MKTPRPRAVGKLREQGEHACEGLAALERITGIALGIDPSALVSETRA